MNAPVPSCTLRQPVILVVDDARDNIEVIKALLRDDYAIISAMSGELALALAAARPQPDLILLDVLMPGLDGYEVIKRLKANPQTRDIPVIFISALNDSTEELRGFDLGAIDYINKPFIPAVMRARVRTQIALRLAREKIEQQNLRLSAEKRLVEDIILRLRSSSDFEPRHLRTLMSAADVVNGDVLLAAFAPDGRQQLLVGDIAGHGIPAAVCAPLISHVFYGAARRGIAMAQTIAEINAVLSKKLPDYVFLAASFVEVAADRRSAKLWNFGMPAALLGSAGKVIRQIEAQHPPLGTEAEYPGLYVGEFLETQAGQRLYLFSDGIIEVDDAQGEPFGLDGLHTFVERLTAGTAVPEDLIPLLTQYQGHNSFPDDITLVELAF
jgi:CheY-like chemotaxis protein